MPAAEAVREAADKQLAFLSKVVRTCQIDPDADFLVNQCKEKITYLEFVLGHMRTAQQEARSGGSLTDDFTDWADELLQPVRLWETKNKKVCNHYLTAQQMPDGKKKKKKNDDQPEAAA